MRGEQRPTKELVVGDEAGKAGWACDEKFG